MYPLGNARELEISYFPLDAKAQPWLSIFNFCAVHLSLDQIVVTSEVRKQNDGVILHTQVLRPFIWLVC